MKSVEVIFYDSDAHCGNDFYGRAARMLDEVAFNALIEHARVIDSWWQKRKTATKAQEEDSGKAMTELAKILALSIHESQHDCYCLEIPDSIDARFEITMEDEWYGDITLLSGENLQIVNDVFSSKLFFYK